MPAVDFADAESMIGLFLRSRLVPPVSTKIPNPRPARFVRAWRTGGVALNRVIDQAQITVTCTAPNSVQASDDARAARAALLNDYTSMPLVRGVEEVSGPYFDPDPDTNEDRYSFTVRLNIRGRR